MDEANNYFEESGRPQYFRLDKSLPISEGKGQLKDFNFEEHILKLAKYLKEKLNLKDEVSTLEEKLLRSGISGFNDDLIKHVGGADTQVDLLGKLYKDGMPECFFYHATGDHIIPHGRSGIAEKIKANQLGSKKFTYFSDSLIIIQENIHLSNATPVIVCYPMKEAWEAALGNPACEARYTSDTVNLHMKGMNFSKVKSEDISNITKNMKVFLSTQSYNRLTSHVKNV